MPEPAPQAKTSLRKGYHHPSDLPPQVPQSEDNQIEELLIPSKIRGAGYRDLKKSRAPKRATG
jgi:hypothetical protein